MFSRLLPPRIDNSYSGRYGALWILGLVVFVKMAMGLNTIFNGHRVATSADGIPLDTFSPDAVAAVLSLLALWGLWQVTFGLLAMLALARYRAMVPLMLVVLLFEQLGRKLILLVLPMTSVASPPGLPINLALVGVMIVGFVLSLWARKETIRTR